MLKYLYQKSPLKLAMESVIKIKKWILIFHC